MFDSDTDHELLKTVNNSMDIHLHSHWGLHIETKHPLYIIYN